MVMSKLCIICHQWTSPPGEEQPPLSPHHIIPDDANLEEDGEGSLTKVEEKMKIFFALLISHLDLYEDKSEDGGCGAEGGVPELLEKAIKGGLLLCGGCLQTVDGFVKLYRQLKAVEGRLNSKLRKLTNVMFHAQTGTSRIKGFMEAATNTLNVEEYVADKLVILKRRLVRKGRKVLRAAKASQLPEEKPLKLNPEGSTEPCSKDPTPGRRPSIKSGHGKSPSSSTSTAVGTTVQEPQQPAPFHHRPGSEDEWLLPDSPPYVKYEKESEDEDEAFDIFQEEHHSACEEPEQTAEVEEQVTPAPPAEGPASPSGTPDVTDVSDDDDGDAKLDGDDTDCFFIIRPTSSTSQAPIKIPRPSRCRDLKTKLYNCQLCPTQLRNPRAFRVHYESDHMHLKFGCVKCNREFTRRGAFSRHYQHVHMGIRNFSCDKCGRTFTRKCYLEAHKPQTCDGVFIEGRKRGGGTKPPRKRKSPKVTPKPSPKKQAGGLSKRPISRRKKQVEPEPIDDREYSCRRCQQIFKSFGEQRRHVKEAHPKSEESGVCDICGRGFPTFERLAFHISTVHCKTRNFVCELCGAGAVFKRADHLDDHRNGVHFGIRKPRAPRQRKRRRTEPKAGNEDPKPTNEGGESEISHSQYLNL